MQDHTYTEIVPNPFVSFYCTVGLGSIDQYHILVINISVLLQ